MTQFLWTSHLSTGHDKIDEDHQKLFQMINAFHDALDQDRGKELIGRVLNNLVTYTRVHFRREEEAMARINYPHLLEHQLQHEQFIKDIQLLVKNFDSGSTINPAYVARMLSDWLRHHIVHVDTRLTPFLKDDQHF